MKTICIIQARTGSSRLPNKVLKLINGYPLIEWVIKRVKKSKKINKIILATTYLKEDEKLKKIALKNKIFFHRGNKNNVLKRFNDIALKYKPNFIVRVCADNPFIEPKMLDKLVTKFNHKKFDYAFNHQPKFNINRCSDGFGAEIMSYKLLKKLNFLATKSSHREHVTLYVWKNVRKFKIQSVKCSKKLSFPNLKFDINTKQDLKKLSTFASKYKLNFNTNAEKIVKLYTRHE